MNTPTNGEIAVMIKSLTASFVEFTTSNKEEHNRIESQVQKTNGRVTSLEKTKYMAIGAIVFINVIIVPIILSYFSNHLKI